MEALPVEPSSETQGRNADLLQPKFDDIIKDAELKLLDVATEDLRSDVKACEEAILQREKDIDGTIAQWKSHLQKLKELTADQVNDLVNAAAAFVTKLSSDSAVSRASKALQAEITNRESKRENMDSNEQFMPTESTIREIIRQEICHAQESNAASNRQRKVSFSDNSGRRSRPKHREQKQRRPHNKSKSPQNRNREQKLRKQPPHLRGRSKSPRSNSTKRVTSPRSSAKNVKGKGSGPVK